MPTTLNYKFYLSKNINISELFMNLSGLDAILNPELLDAGIVIAFQCAFLSQSLVEMNCQFIVNLLLILLSTT
jgi:hypothetical protein